MGCETLRRQPQHRPAATLRGQRSAGSRIELCRVLARRGSLRHLRRGPSSPRGYMISVVVPACNEEGVIRRCLDAILGDARPGEIEVVVACNGCVDRTAAIARGVPGVVVVETAERSKARALNLGDAHASAFPRLYVDADVRLSTDAVRSLAAALRDGAALAAPRAAIRTDHASWPVRAFHRAWEATPYFRAGFVGCGVYALSEAGR